VVTEIVEISDPCYLKRFRLADIQEAAVCPVKEDDEEIEYGKLYEHRLEESRFGIPEPRHVGARVLLHSHT